MAASAADAFAAASEGVKIESLKQVDHGMPIFAGSFRLSIGTVATHLLTGFGRRLVEGESSSP